MKVMMLKKKIVTIRFNSARWDNVFMDYTLRNGKHVYIINDGTIRLTTKEEGNEQFQKVSKLSSVDKITLTTTLVDQDLEIERYKEKIDPFTAYIDSWKQQKEAERSNDRYREIIKALRGE